MNSTPNTPIEELALIFKTHTFERSGLIDVPSVKIALLAWRDRAVAEAIKKELTWHISNLGYAVGYTNGQRYLTNELERAKERLARLITPTKEREEK